MIAGLRLAVSLLTVLPVGLRPDGPITAPEAGRAMTVAPLVGLIVGGAAAGMMAGAQEVGLSGLLAATLAVATVAAVTRGLHLDGLADTADGLGSGRPADGALAVMRSGDTGPFGVVTLVLVLLVQVTAAAQAGPAALLLAVVTGRVALAWSCRRGVPAARHDGLGVLVASSVRTLAALGAVVLTAVVAGLVDLPAAAAVVAGVVAGEVLLRLAVRRLGGVTGDVLGAVCETAVTTSLVVLAGT